MKKYISQDEITRRFTERGKPHIVALSGSLGFEDRFRLKCTIHDYEWEGELRSVLYKTYVCPICARESVREKMMSKHDLRMEAPEIANLLENSDDAIGVARTSKVKRWFLCPKCGARLFKSVVAVSCFGLRCNECSDGFSYPNKFMRSVLTQLDIEFVDEYSPEWISPKRYDFFFKNRNKRYIVEMDGDLGHGKKTYGNILNPFITLNNDVVKDEIAREHGIKVIRINCSKSEKEYIRGQIESSFLNELFDLSTVNWDVADESSKSSTLIEIINFYSKYPFYSYKDMSNKFNVCEDSVRKAIKFGFEKGLCPQYTESYGKYILCIDSQMIFPSAIACAKYYNVDSKGVARVCNKERNSVGGLHFIWLKDFDGNIDDLVPQPSVTTTSYEKKFLLNVYDEQKNYIGQYRGKGAVGKKFHYAQSTVAKVLNEGNKLPNGYYVYFANDCRQPFAEMPNE